MREASTEPDDETAPSDDVGSEIEVDGKSADGYTNGDGHGDDVNEPNGVHPDPQSQEIVVE